MVGISREEVGASREVQVVMEEYFRPGLSWFFSWSISQLHVF